MPLVVERLNDLTPGDADALLSDSERFGSRIVRRLVEDWSNATNRFDRPGEALFVAWADGLLVGVCGLNVDPYTGNERVGRVRHLYVSSAFRRRGVGRQLVMHVIQAAHGRFDNLHLRTNNVAAVRLYETLGFAPCSNAGDTLLAERRSAAAGPSNACSGR
jgi:ribosomal protein S18 acetylase RimI-like enzyme